LCEKQQDISHMSIAGKNYQLDLSSIPIFLQMKGDLLLIRRPQPYRYYIIIDFEATCEKDMKFEYENEIIEFPAILLDTTTNQIVSIFHSYVRPTKNPTLTSYCIELTGIQQQQVDQSEDFVTVYREFERWIERYQLNPTREGNTAFITDGPWDLRDFLRKQCDISGMKPATWFNHWVNLRRGFRYFYFYKKNLPVSSESFNIDTMLKRLGWTFEGRMHSGLHDSFNITRIVQRMILDGCQMRINEDFDTSMARLKEYREKSALASKPTLSS
jgi:3'-5' exoribonuclease 1